MGNKAAEHCDAIHVLGRLSIPVFNFKENNGIDACLAPLTPLYPPEYHKNSICTDGVARAICDALDVVVELSAYETTMLNRSIRWAKAPNLIAPSTTGRTPTGHFNWVRNGQKCDLFLDKTANVIPIDM